MFPFTEILNTRNFITRDVRSSVIIRDTDTKAVLSVLSVGMCQLLIFKFFRVSKITVRYSAVYSKQTQVVSKHLEHSNT